MHAQLAPQASILSPTSQWIWVSSGKITTTNSLLVKRACECCYIQKGASMVELAAVKTAVQRQRDFFGMGAQGPGSEVSTTCRMSCHTACITALFSSKWMCSRSSLLQGWQGGQLFREGVETPPPGGSQRTLSPQYSCENGVASGLRGRALP